MINRLRNHGTLRNNSSASRSAGGAAVSVSCKIFHEFWQNLDDFHEFVMAHGSYEFHERPRHQEKTAKMKSLIKLLPIMLNTCATCHIIHTPKSSFAFADFCSFLFLAVDYPWNSDT